MAQRKKEPARERRISMEIVVVAHDAWEPDHVMVLLSPRNNSFPFSGDLQKEKGHQHQV